MPAKAGDQVMIVNNETLAPLYLDAIRSVLEPAGARVVHLNLTEEKKKKYKTNINDV